MRKKKLEDVIKEAKIVHNDFYRYDKVTEYKSCDSEVVITCPIHGDFNQTFYYHINKRCGCPICGHVKSNNAKRLKIEEVKRRIRECGYKVPLNFVYVNNNTPSEIICPKHGLFSIRLGLLFKGERCKYCSNEIRSEKQILSNEEFIKRLNALYGDRIDTSKVEYKGEYKPVTVICKKHGEYKSLPYSLYKGICCNQCKKETLSKLKTKTQEQFLNESKAIYGEELKMDRVQYVDEDTPILIGCRIHGYVPQTPRVHLRGNGCSLCLKSKMERYIETRLKEMSILFVQEKKLPNSLLRLDFYLPEYNCAIECQGKQHFKEIEHFGGSDGFNKTNERDKRKQKLCYEHNIRLFYFSDVNGYETFLGETVYHSFQELIDKVKENNTITNSNEQFGNKRF